MKKIRLYGNPGNLTLTSRNSWADCWRLELYVMIDGTPQILSKEQLFNGYSRRQIFQHLKAGIIADLKKYGIEAR